MSAPQFTPFFERINILGAPDTACVSDNDRGYCEAVRDCLPIVAEADEVCRALYEALAYVMSAHGEQLHDAFDMAERALAKARGEA